MKLGIIGKPQSGKTTVFNAACQMQEAVGDYSQAVHFLENGLVSTDQLRSILSCSISMNPEERPFNIADLYDQLQANKESHVIGIQKNKTIGLIISNTVITNVQEFTLHQSDSVTKKFIINDLNQSFRL